MSDQQFAQQYGADALGHVTVGVRLPRPVHGIPLPAGNRVFGRQYFSVPHSVRR
jgi:hypothetical protein